MNDFGGNFRRKHRNSKAARDNFDRSTIAIITADASAHGSNLTFSIASAISVKWRVMAGTGILLAVLSGVCNGLFTTPMKLIAQWKWEHIWFVFIVIACLCMPVAMTLPVTRGGSRQLLSAVPLSALAAALTFGFAWGFGAICFGRSVDKLGVSIANSLVIGLSSAFGSLVPLLLAGTMRLERRQIVLFGGVIAFLIGVLLCGQAGRMRDGGSKSAPQLRGYVFAIAAGIMSAVFNIGYSLALPIADTGASLGYSRFAATNFIWLLMLGAGSLPNLAYCLFLMKRHGTTGLVFSRHSGRAWALSVLMGLLWGGSIFLYGAATPRLGEIGPSIGWPLSLATGLLVANAMGLLLGEWRGVDPKATRRMKLGVSTLIAAIVLCAVAARWGATSPT
jgi:L-rhamnose-H+ transport protein